MRRVIAIAVMSTCSLLTVSCNDGGEGILASPPVASDRSPAGVWTGSFTSTAQPPGITNLQVVGVISEDLEAQFLVAYPTAVCYSGDLAVSGDQLSGTLTVHTGKRGAFVGFDGANNIGIDGIVLEGDGIFGDYSGPADQGRFNLNYDQLYERGSSLDLISGIWTYTELYPGGVMYTVTIQIDANGQLFGSDTSGCVLSGNIRIIDARFNAYRANVVASSCDAADGACSGLAFLLDWPGGHMNLLNINTANANFAFAVGLNK